MLLCLGAYRDKPYDTLEATTLFINIKGMERAQGVKVLAL